MTWLALEALLRHMSGTASSQVTNAWKISTSQIGWVTESVVGASLIARTDGRIAPFTPAADDCGIDLLALDKASGRSIALQVKAWTGTPSSDLTVQFDTRKKTYNDFSFLVAVYMPLPNLSIEYAWFIPMPVVKELSSERAGKYIVRCSTRPKSRDAFSRFRMDVDGLTASVLAELT